MNMPVKKQIDVVRDFISKHGETYDYSLVEYKSATTKIKVICKKHGIFLITPNSHKNGSGCAKCGRIKVENSRRLTLEEFIDAARKKHGYTYDYSMSVYTGYYDKIDILCPKHGVFQQQARKHLLGNKCKKCQNENLYVDFVFMCKEIFPDYSYEKVNYKGMFIPVIITCKTHGDFLAKPITLIHKKRGCKDCIDRTKSKPEQLWLDELNIPLNNRNVYINLGGKVYCVDGIDYDNKVIYEFYGDFFHGNPTIYDENDINPLLKETYGSLYRKTLEKEKAIFDFGFRLVSIWEKDFKNKK
jgi:hypothetical protein